ncbi:uncharacterized protein LOC128222507 [Mya arenaria]|uniref:uncharacterized protein LOC128222507 n=1 Tax=Mya arenaria TaxID=6604 RepID=UPI0022E69A30|nr:uncharacterized protein LOC128222507 [Mya arenaria]
MELHWVIIVPIVGLLLFILVIIACCYAWRKCEKQRKGQVERSLRREELEGSATFEDGYNRRTFAHSASTGDYGLVSATFGYEVAKIVPCSASRVNDVYIVRSASRGGEGLVSGTRRGENLRTTAASSASRVDERLLFGERSVFRGGEELVSATRSSENFRRTVARSTSRENEGSFAPSASSGDEGSVGRSASRGDEVVLLARRQITGENSVTLEESNHQYTANKNTGTKQPTVEHMDYNAKNAINISFMLTKTSILGRFCVSYHLKHLLEYLSVNMSYPSETILASNRDAIPNFCTMFQNDFAHGMLTSVVLSNTAERKSGLHHYQSERVKISYYPNGIFVHEVIGGIGGKITLQDIILHIPSEALEQDTLITLGVIWERQMFDSLRSGNEDVVLSPIVVCQPSGLQLKRKCTLEIPHCAYQPNTFWVMDVKTCHGDLLTTCSYKWITVSTNSIAIEERKLLIDVNHFTLYACVGVTKAPSHAAKRMHLVSFLDATQTTHNTVKQRVYCLNDYSVDLKVAAEREITLGAPPKMSDSTQLLVYDTGKDVIVEVDSLNDQWRVLGSSSERLPYALVWEAYTPHCTLVFEGATVAGTKSEKLVCDILAYQDGNDNNVGKLKIAENVFGELPESIVRIQSQRNQVAETLKEMLDPINECATNAGDWQALAEKMGCSYVRIKWLETQIGSPTVVLIHQWFAEGRTLGELIQKLEEINRPDAVQELRNLKTQNDLDNQKLHLNENMQVHGPYLNKNKTLTPAQMRESETSGPLTTYL